MKNKKQQREPPKLWEGFGTIPPTVPVASTERPAHLLQRRRANPWPLLTPIILLALVIAGSYWYYQEYLAPTYAAQESAYEETLTVAEEYEGETVQEKTQSDECYSLVFNRDTDIHTLCVSEELWDEQTVGTPFDVGLLRSDEETTELQLPWEF